MAGSNWQQLAGGSVNPYDIRRDDGTLTADYGEHIISDGGTVTLPSPKGDEAVLVSNISQDTTVTTSTGLVEQQSDVTHSSTTSGPVLFVSDGSDWYVANNLDYISTIPDSVADNFEAADADPPGIYESGEGIADYYSGDTGSFGLTTSNVGEATQALQQDHPSQGDFIVSEPGDGLNRYPQQDERFACLLRDPQPLPSMLFGATISGVEVSGYSVGTNGASDELRIYRWDGGSNTKISSTPASLSEDDWYDYEVEWESDGSMTARVFDWDETNEERGSEIASTSTTDTNHTFNGLGVIIRGTPSVSTTAVADYYRVLEVL